MVAHLLWVQEVGGSSPPSPTPGRTHVRLPWYTPRMVRRCGRCGELKAIAEFNWRRRARNQRDNYCRACRAAYKREHYARNKPRYIANTAARNRAVREARTVYLLEFFATHPCVDCGETDPLVLEFDHLGDKLFNVGNGLRDRAWASVLAEMAKCEVVCANCHRRRTALRGGFLRAAVAQRQSLALPRR